MWNLGGVVKLYFIEKIKENKKIIKSLKEKVVLLCIINKKNKIWWY